MASQDWLNKLNSLGDKPTYESKYQSSIDDLLNKITNRESFSYDFNADPLYQQYKDNYTKLGNEASMNAVANVSNMTGGYGNSYAATAASQANQQYLTQLNNVIPELANAALNKYQMETQNLYNQYSAVGDAEDRLYGQYRDNVSDYYTNRNYYYNGYTNDRNYEYQQERDRIADEQWQKQFDYNKDVNDRNYNYQVSTDDRNYAYQLARDMVEDEQWEKQYQLSLLNSRNRSGNGSGDKDNTKNAAEEKDLSEYLRLATFYTQHVSNSTNNVAMQYLAALVDEGKISKSQYADLLYESGTVTEAEYKKLLQKGY